MYEQNAASQLDLDNALAAYNIAKANVAMSKADLDQANLELSYTVVRSPIDGYMGQRKSRYRFFGRQLQIFHASKGRKP